MGGAKKISPAKAQRRQADEAAKKTGSKSKKEKGDKGEIKSTKSAIRVILMLERNNLNGVKKISPKHDGTHVVFDKMK